MIVLSNKKLLNKQDFWLIIKSINSLQFKFRCLLLPAHNKKLKLLEVKMFKKIFSPILQTIFLIIAIAGFYFLFDDGFEPAEDPNGGWTCPAVAGCTASGCTGSIRKKCTYTSTDGQTVCPTEDWCNYRF